MRFRTTIELGGKTATVTGAKTDETRARGIGKSVETLRAGRVR